MPFSPAFGFFNAFMRAHAMKCLIVVNDAPYGDERCYNALRLGQAAAAQDAGAEIIVFLMADAVGAAKKGQKTPEGYYSIERMLKRLMLAKGSVLLCGTCMDARGMGDGDLIEGARRSNMAELASETLAADKVLVF